MLPWLVVTGIVVALLAALPHRRDIAPLVGGDNNYIFLAVDRLCAGLGPTSLPPSAPLQPWTWRRDWAFLTNWPVGYVLLIALARGLLHTDTLSAAVALGVASCGVALVGWYAWIRTCLPARFPAGLIALLAALSTFTIDNLINPGSDTLLLAATPLLLLLVQRIRGARPAERKRPAPIRGTGPGATRAGLWFGVGLAAGLMVWIRYAAIFLPIGLGMYLLGAAVRGTVTRRSFAACGLGAVLPLAALLTVNRLCGDDLSAGAQLNLGQRLSTQFQPGDLALAWHGFTRQTFYAHRPESGLFFAAVLPGLALTVPLLRADSRRRMREFLGRPPVVLSLVMTATLLTVLVAASTLFRTKFHYVSLERYYQPIKPFYFLFFIGPLLTCRRPILRVAASVPLLLAGAWLVRQDAGRTWQRWLAAERPRSTYGKWAQVFQPHTNELYAWLGVQNGTELVVLSNFHDEIALETGLPACPVPRDPAELGEWLGRIRAARGVSRLRVLFVLDFDNTVRDYFLPAPAHIVEVFGLTPAWGVPADLRRFVFAPPDPPLAPPAGNLTNSPAGQSYRPLTRGNPLPALQTVSRRSEDLRTARATGPGASIRPSLRLATRSAGPRLIPLPPVPGGGSAA